MLQHPKRHLLTTLFLILSCLSVAAHAAMSMPLPKPPAVDARSYILVDAQSGQILAESEADTQIEPASITKVMSSYVVISEIAKGNLSEDDLVTISEKAWRMGGSKMFIEVGKQVSVIDLMRGMIVQSGNDATVALAEHIAGTEDSFAAYMNQYAAKLGMSNTHFTNATGWPHPEHYTTARDIATLSKALIADFPEHYALYAEKEFRYNNITQHNRNLLLWRDESVDGIKTGHTESAGFCLASSAVRDGMRLISVVIGADGMKSRTRYSQALLNYGFRFFETRKLFDGTAPMDTVRVWKGATQELGIGTQEDFYITVPRGRFDDINVQAELSGQIFAPVSEGQKLGVITASLDDKVLTKADIQALNEVPAGSWWQRLMDEARLFMHR